MAHQSTGLVGSAILSLVDERRNPTGARRLIGILAIAAPLVAGGLLVHATGGTRLSYVHVMYIPIALAAFLFHAPGGVIAGLAAGMVVGPFMDLDVAMNTPQPREVWGIRMAIFAVAGLLVGELAALLDRRIDMLAASSARVQRTYARTLRTLASVIAIRDEPTGGHCERVAHNACAVARAMGMDGEQVEALYWAGLLHDLGKIAVPERILLKEGALDRDEIALVQRHPAIGAALIEAISPDFRAIAAGVRSHHEAFDGSGYPHGLAGAEIPLFGRILAVVDVFEALTSLRPYREPQSTATALAFLREKAGERFDPAVVEAFERIYASGKIWTSGEPPVPLLFDAPERFDAERLEAVAAR